MAIPVARSGPAGEARKGMGLHLSTQKERIMSRDTSLGRFGKLGAVAFGVAVVGLGALAGPALDPAEAGSVDLQSAKSSQWKAEWTSAQISDDGSTKTALKLKKTLQDATALTINFNQQAKSADDQFGLRITLSETITNMFKDKDLIGFLFQITANKPLEVPAGADPLIDPTNPMADVLHHPAGPHFHDDGVKDASGKLTLLTPIPPPDSDGNPGSSFALLFGNGVVKFGESWNPVGIGIHEWESKNFRRSFTITEMPLFVSAVPEPSSLVLVTFGAGWIFYRMYRRRSAA
jgi:hypothetical protein